MTLLLTVISFCIGFYTFYKNQNIFFICNICISKIERNLNNRVGICSYINKETFPQFSFKELENFKGLLFQLRPKTGFEVTPNSFYFWYLGKTGNRQRIDFLKKIQIFCFIPFGFYLWKIFKK